MADLPPEVSAEVIAMLKQLERKGIRWVNKPDYREAPEPDAGDPPEAPKAGAAGVDAEPPPLFAGESPAVASADKVPALTSLHEKVSVCTDCALHGSRTNAVFGVGNPDTKVMFIGEAPGRDEDLKGEPFVGRSGQLLTKILAAIDLKREDVYIANILKCRPPDNRDPQEPEVRCCEKYLIAQIELIQPKLICALGRVAAQWLLQTNAPLGTLRAGEYYYQGIRILATYHPAALLRNPNFKRPAWEDFKKLKAMLDAA